MSYIYRVQCEGRIMRQVEVESEGPLSDEELTAKALEVFHEEEWASEFTEVEVGESECVSYPNEN